MIQDLRSWSDEELCRVCIPRKWEAWLGCVGCVALPLVSAAFLFLWYVLWPKDVFLPEGVVFWVLGTFLLCYASQVICEMAVPEAYYGTYSALRAA